MTDAEILATIRAVAFEEISAPAGMIVPAVSAAMVPGWDSLAHVRIIMNLEHRLGVVLDIDATYAAAEIEGLIAVVRAALANRR
jgi:acyl carrier protein